MPLLKCQSSKSTPQKVMSYVTDPTKAEYISVQNLFEDEDYAKQFTETMKRFHKGEKYDERKYYHFKLSCNRKDKVLHQEAHLFAEELAAKLFFDFECVIATHTDTQTMDDEKTSKIYCAAANLRNEIPATDICRISVKMQPSMYNRKEKTCFIDDIMGFQKEEEIKAFIKKTLDSCLFVYPKFYTEREKMQQSVFMIMPNKIFDTTDKIDFENENWKTKLENESSILRRYKFLPKLHNPLLAQAVEVSEIEDNDYGDILWELVIPNNVVCKLKKRLDNMGIVDKEYCIESKCIEDVIDKYFEEKNPTRLYCAICFSQAQNKLSQWIKYADNAQGVALGFNTEQLIALTKSPYFRFDKVIYDKQKIFKEVEAVFKTLFEDEAWQCKKDQEKRASFENAIERAVTVFNHYAPFYKDSFFAEEEEWRLVYLPKGNINRVHSKGFEDFECDVSSNVAQWKYSGVHFMIKNKNLCSYVELDFSEIKQRFLKEIVIAPNAPFGKLDGDLSLFLKRNGYKWAERRSLDKLKIIKVESSFKNL